MSDTTTAEAATTTPEATGSETQPTPEQKVSPEQDPIALARKRQAGAEAARQQAEKQRDDALAELEKYRASERSQADKDLADLSKLQERLTAAEKRAAEAEAKAEGRILDIKYPHARAALPEITDEVRLAQIEALMADDEPAAPPAPQNPNESNRAASGDATARKPAEETSEDIKARLKAMKPDWL